MRISDWSSDVCSSDLIRCNVVSPGLILTQTARDNAAPGQFDTSASHSLTPFLGDPMDIASAVVFLASDNARFYTGQVMVVDGGYHGDFPPVEQQEWQRVVCGKGL